MKDTIKKLSELRTEIWRVYHDAKMWGKKDIIINNIDNVIKQLKEDFDVKD